jgi:hypothetical protein
MMRFQPGARATDRSRRFREVTLERLDSYSVPQYRETYKAQSDPALDSGYFRIRFVALFEDHEIPLGYAALASLFT